MKKRILPHICLIGIVSLFTFSVNATIYFDDNFDAYDDGALYNQGGWVKYGTNTDNPIQLTATNLTYDGYQSEAMGKAVQLQKFTDKDSEDLQKALTTPFNPVSLDSKTFYMSFLVNVQEAGAAPFISLCDANTTFADGSSGTQKVYVLAKEGSTMGKVKFAVSKNSETANLAETSTEFDLNTTCLVVLKYTANPADIDDDQIDMYVNPVITSEAANSSLCTATEGSDINVTKGLASVQLRQRRTWSIQSSAVIVDAIRIADTWNELFGLEEPPVTDQPTLTVDETEINFGYPFVGDELSQTINIKAEHLTGDITIDGLSGDVVASVTTISKEDAMTETGANITLTLTPTQAGEFTQNLTVSSENAATLTIPVTWYANPSVANIKALLEAYGGENDYNTYRVEGEMVVTHVYSMNGVLTMTVQDETGAMFIQDAYEMITETYTVGDRLEKISGMLTNSWGVYYFNPIMMGTAIRNEPVEPQLVTLAELQANPLDYMARLVRVNDVTFSTTGSFSTQQVEITQDGTTGKVGLFANSDIIGETIPAKADVIGISRNTTGQLISPRFKADIIVEGATTDIPQSTIADNIWTDKGTLYINLQEDTMVQIYNLQGKQVYGGNMTAGMNRLSLEQGVYLIRLNENTTKFLIK
ncbi:MAG: T9SS type A sorting domain-containing protein [Bacteroidetes bacterium]|uniref:T9SS type A sorting domain-containing protein n=1 Tax=Candidatus Gallipaludibacter merdavium TaxID=2840839 RepID=A0A9D9HWJ7_9BACT|nr:T9SS type A sorting domain-containing protein [Candidatus Gallipaludibacter merdavium]